MLAKSVARRYASAFFTLAQETNQLEEFESQLRAVIEAMQQNRELKKVFYHKLIQPRDKKEVIKHIFEGKLAAPALNFLLLLIDKKREAYLESILEQYVALANQARNIMDADVISAVELSPKDIKELQARLSMLTGKNVRVRAHVDPKILGGLVVRVGDRIVDGSVTKRLQTLKNNMVKAQLRFT